MLLAPATPCLWLGPKLPVSDERFLDPNNHHAIKQKRDKETSLELESLIKPQANCDA